MRKVMPSLPKPDQDDIAQLMVSGVPNPAKFNAALTKLSVDENIFTTPDQKRTAYRAMIAMANPQNATDDDKAEVKNLTNYYKPDTPIGNATRQAQTRAASGEDSDNAFTRHLKTSWGSVARIPSELSADATRFVRDNTQVLAEAANTFNPGADVVDMKNESAATMKAFNEGRYSEAAAHLLGTGAATAMLFTPGHYSQAKKGAEAITNSIV